MTRLAVHTKQSAPEAAQDSLEKVLGGGLETLSNYTNHIAITHLDAAFTPTAVAEIQLRTNGRH